MVRRGGGDGVGGRSGGVDVSRLRMRLGWFGYVLFKVMTHQDSASTAGMPAIMISD